jgi:SlyX protein
MTKSVEARIIELERRLAFHESMAEDLSSIVAEQGKIIDTLTLHVRNMTERLRGVEAVTGERSPQDDKPPPHY